MQAEAAAAAGERAVRGFMVAVQRATSNVALVQQVRILDLINILHYPLAMEIFRRDLVLK